MILSTFHFKPRLWQYKWKQIIAYYISNINLHIVSELAPDELSGQVIKHYTKL